MEDIAVQLVEHVGGMNDLLLLSRISKAVHQSFKKFHMILVK